MSSSISILSLVLGLTFCLTILSYTSNEKNWDSYIPDHENKYRLTFEIYGQDGLNSNSATSPAPYGPFFSERIPEIKNYIRFVPVRNCLLSNPGTSSLQSDKVAFGDSDILDFFGVPMLSGDDSFFDEKSIVISRSLAVGLFGTPAALGKSLTFNGIEEFEVKGVFEDFPMESTVSLDLIGTIDFMQVVSPTYYQNGDNWGGYAFHTYFDLIEGADIDRIVSAFGELYRERFQIDPEDLPSEYMDFDLMNIQDIHLYSKLGRELTPPNDAQRIQLFEYLAHIIAIIGWINFINIQTSRGPERIKEINIRKTLGAFSSDLKAMFSLEYLIMNSIALVVALSLVKWIVPASLTSYIGDLGITGPSFDYGLISFLATGILVSSIYPGIQIALQKGQSLISRSSKKGFHLLRNVLVVTQFSVSIFLIVYTTVIYLQVKHLSSQDPGFDSSQVVVINGPVSQNEYIEERAELFKQQLSSFAGIRTVSSAGIAPGLSKGWQGNLPSFDGDNSRFQTSYLSNITDHFFEVFDIELLSGTIPQGSTNSIHPRVIINEEAAHGFGWDIQEAIGKKVGYTDTAVVVGVVENFNAVGFQEAVSPMVFILDHVYHRRTVHDFFLVRFDGSLAVSTIEKSRELYAGLFPDNPFEFTFTDDLFRSNYEAEILYNRKFALFSMLSILLAMMGLVGLTIYHTLQKRKEIGIRKVLGSTELKVIYLFVKKYAVLLSIATVITVPITVFFTRKWLDDFASRIDLNALIVLLPILLLAAMAMITVGSISMRAAKLNPVDVLKDE